MGEIHEMVRHTSLRKWGDSSALIIPKAVRAELTWRVGDMVAIRVAGDKVILERIPLEQLAKMRTGEPEAHQ